MPAQEVDEFTAGTWWCEFRLAEISVHVAHLPNLVQEVVDQQLGKVGFAHILGTANDDDPSPGLKIIDQQLSRLH